MPTITTTTPDISVEEALRQISEHEGSEHQSNPALDWITQQSTELPKKLSQTAHKITSEASKAEDTLYNRSDIYHSLKDAFTAPIRAARGEIDTYSPEGAEEAFGTAQLMLGGGLGASTVKPIPRGSLASGPARIHNPSLSEALDTGLSARTLESLPQNQSTIKPTSIRQQLARSDIPKPEKDIFTKIQSEHGDFPIQAEDLVNKFRHETQGMSLKPKDTPKYGDYGLEKIDRSSSSVKDLEASIKRVERDSQNMSPDGLGVKQGLQLLDFYKESLQQVKSNPIRARTTKYQLPYEVSKANHLKDPQLFGWTRSFDQGGVRHVIEIQSDLSQKLKVLTPEQLKLAKDEKARVYKEKKDLESKVYFRRGQPDPAPNEFVRGQRIDELTEKEIRLHELNSKIKFSKEAPAIREALGTNQVLTHDKYWPRRLIQEEMAQAAPQGKIRFATADTVAKVEGWPRTPNGPTQFDPTYQGIYDRYNNEITNYLKSLGGKPYTDYKGHTWIEVPVPKNFRPKLVGAALGGVSLNDDPDHKVGPNVSKLPEKQNAMETR